jgi:hypothetical protein
MAGLVPHERERQFGPTLFILLTRRRPMQPLHTLR